MANVNGLCAGEYSNHIKSSNVFIINNDVTL